MSFFGAAAGQTAGDVTPAAVNWANITSPTNVNADQTISSIGVPITLRATVSGAGGTGAITIGVWVNGSAVAAIPAPSDGSSVEWSVVSGDTVHFACTIFGGTRTGTVTVTNQSDGGASLDTFTYNVTG